MICRKINGLSRSRRDLREAFWPQAASHFFSVGSARYKTVNTSGAGAPGLHWLKPINKIELLARMLRNLKLIYARQGDDVMLFKMIHWILTLQPEAPAELSERAQLYEAMGNPTRAAEDW